MDLVHRTVSASTADASFDTLARTVGQRLPRRQALRLLAVTLATSALGTAALTEAAAKAKSHGHSSHSKAKSHSKGSLTAKRRKGGLAPAPSSDQVCAAQGLTNCGGV